MRPGIVPVGDIRRWDVERHDIELDLRCRVPWGPRHDGRNDGGPDDVTTERAHGGGSAAREGYAEVCYAEVCKESNMDDKMRRWSVGRQIDPARRITIAEP